MGKGQQAGGTDMDDLALWLGHEVMFYLSLQPMYGRGMHFYCDKPGADIEVTGLVMLPYDLTINHE